MALEASSPMRLHDKFGRTITDLRISITDRCNYKCVYCRTGNDGASYAHLSHYSHRAHLNSDHLSLPSPFRTRLRSRGSFGSDGYVILPRGKIRQCGLAVVLQWQALQTQGRVKNAANNWTGHSTRRSTCHAMRERRGTAICGVPPSADVL